MWHLLLYMIVFAWRPAARHRLQARHSLTAPTFDAAAVVATPLALFLGQPHAMIIQFQIVMEYYPVNVAEFT